MRKTVEILGVQVDSMTMSQAMEKLSDFLAADNTLAEFQPAAVFTPNSEIIMAAQRDSSLMHMLNKADMLTADGAGVVLASKILGCEVPEKVSGIDIVRNAFSYFANKKVRYYFFGSKPGVAEMAANKVPQTYPGAVAAGFRDGYFKPEENEKIIEHINSSGADILLVALGAPKQEKWIFENRKKLKVKICMGVGGTLDVLSGTASLAPEFFRKNGLEWLYRLAKEPWRAKRMMDLPRFMLRVFKARIKP